MTWKLTMLGIHIAAAYGFALLYCTAPDWIQKVVLGLLMASSLILIGVYGAEAVEFKPHWLMAKVALQVEHAGVLLYLFRLIYVERVCKNSSQPSQPYRA